MDLRLYSGSAHPLLSASVAKALGARLGPCRLDRFPDGELSVQIGESVRGHDVYVIQPTSPPANENLMELLLMIDALHRAAAGRITAVIPYFGYARQERRAIGREPITARLVADLLTAANADRVLAVDLHAPAVEGFFDIEVDQLTAVPVLARHLAPRVTSASILVAPDLGAMKLVDRYAKLLRLPTALVLKRRVHVDSETQVEVRALVGDVTGRTPVIVDDMIATGATIHECVGALLDAGARPQIIVAATHAVLVGSALQYLSDEAISEVVVSNTVPIPPEKWLGKMSVVSAADLLARAISRLHRNESVSALTSLTLSQIPA